MRIFITVFFLFIVSCTKQHIKTNDVIYGLTLSPSTVDADGSSIIMVSANINKDAEESKRKIIFETSAGSFSSTGTKTTTLEALYENGLLVAHTSILAPSSPGHITVTARPENRNPYNDFIVKDSVNAFRSTPFSIKITPSAFAVSTDFIGEIQITGTLKNDKNKNVSKGNTVLFEDYFISGVSVNGRYRDPQISSDDNSKVSTYYSPGHVLPGTNFYIRCTVLDSVGNRTSIKDSLLLSVIP